MGQIKGTVTVNGKPMPGVNVGIESLLKGNATDQNGTFLISNIPEGTYLLQASMIGYKKFTKKISIKAGETLELLIELEESITMMDQMVVTGTMRETYIKNSPVKVEVVTKQFLRKNPSGNLMESIDYINGLSSYVACGVCGTNSIRINGMEGPYTAVLIDGMPIMGSLASVYGLNGISPAIIQSIEIIKGPNSTLYGSEAMAGVINIRTKNPELAPLLTFNTYGTTDEAVNFDFSFSPKAEGFSTLFSGNTHYFDNFLDQNNDNFSDAPKIKRISLFNKWSFDRKNERKFDIAFKYLYEERMGGTSNYTKSLRGSRSVYGEFILTNRFAVLGTYDLPVSAQNIRVDFAYSYHDQNSFYGDYHYEANQQVYFTNLIWDKKFSYNRQLLIGGTLRYDQLEQTFDGQRLEDGSEDNRLIPGIFAQYDHIFNAAWRALIGLRVDHYTDHGFIFSPRANLKASVSDHTTFRLNAGTGFRIVNLFTEQHEALTGSRQVVITEDLEPEKSYNATANINQIIDIGYSVLNVDLDIWYTYFTNQIIPDYSRRGEIRYSNLNGHSVSRGVSLSAAHNFPGPFMYSVGVTLQDVYQKRNGIKQPILFSPGFSGVFSLSYDIEPIRLSLDWTGQVTGKMRLPKYEGYSDQSELYTEQNLKITKELNEGLQAYLSIKNLFNYTQESPIIAPDRPFSDNFATDRVFGPMQGRRLLLGIRYELN